MSTHMSKLSNPTESWLTKQQAAQSLQVAEKTIDRMAKAGELQKETFKRPGQVPIVVFHPGDVERAKLARGPQSFIVPETGVQRMSDLQAGVSGKVSGSPVSDMSTPMSKVSKVRLPLWLTLQEAVDYSGLPEATLREFIAGGRVPALDVGRGRRGGRWRIRKVDLREMSPFPLETLHKLPAHADQD